MRKGMKTVFNYVIALTVVNVEVANHDFEDIFFEWFVEVAVGLEEDVIDAAYQRRQLARGYHLHPSCTIHDHTHK